MKTRTTCSALCVLFLLLLNSCTKSDTPEPATNFSKVRLYDDTLPDPRNHSLRIVAGDGRLLMTYGRSFERWLIVNGASILAPPPENVWMLTDNEGNLIKRDTFPKGLAMGDVVSLADNSYMVVTYIGNPGQGGSYDGMQFIHIDQNGVMSAANVLNAPVPEGIMDVYGIHLCRSQNGNAILYFDYYSQNYTTRSFVGEMDQSGNFLWHKDLENYIVTGCIANNEGGYLFTGTIPVYYYEADVFIMKTNGTGDSLWNRIIDAETPKGGQIIPEANGNYFLHYNNFDWSTYTSTTYVCEVSSKGEILKNAYFDFQVNAFLQKKDPDGVFILSSTDAVYGNVTDRFNSTYVTLDAGLNVTEKKLFQHETSDLMNAGCMTSDGKNACFGLVQCYGRRYYKPVLIIMN